MNCECENCKCKDQGIYLEITDSIIIQGEMIKNTPNDMELGKKIREIYLLEKDKNE